MPEEDLVRYNGYGRKKFSGKVDVDGELVSVFHIKYEDGDSEDVDLEELLRIVVPEQAQGGRKGGRRAGARGEQQETQEGEEEEQDEEQEAEQEEGEEDGRREEQVLRRSVRATKGKRRVVESPSPFQQPPHQQQKQQKSGRPNVWASKHKAQEPPARDGSLAATEQVDEGAVTPALPPPAVASPGTQQVLQGVAVRSAALAANITRVPHAPALSPAPGAAASRAVACGGLVFLSAITPALGEPLKDGALEQLDDALRAAGSSKELLVQLTVSMKNMEEGGQAFQQAWDSWAPQHALPALTVQEAFLGVENRLVALTAVAAAAAQAAVTSTS
eukprot:scaffold1.g5817.t1